MTTEWVVAAGAERLGLTASGTAEQPGPSIGELTFTVTNPGPVEDRVVFEIVPGDGAKRPWFTVDEPQRLVPGGQSVTFLIKVSIPAGEPAGPFWVQGRVYSADTAPEESSRVSGRVTGEIAPTKIKKSKPWWLLAVAALVVIVLGVVGWLVLRPGNRPVPALTGLTEEQARQKLLDSGLTLGLVQRRHQAGSERTVIEQSVGEGAEAASGSPVDVVITIRLTAPALQTPQDHQEFPKDAKAPVLQWQAVLDAAGYNIRREREICTGGINSTCFFQVITNANQVGPATSWDPVGEQLPPIRGIAQATGLVRWQITALDDFKDPGPSSGPFEYWILKF
ncbi:Stk1 family PASTA domain-containing Ser/Thr kinase [Microlunatus speluncae]|uniref:Stk1 family PASTA domain-containing Ser/Thr kinase n=1 Tax=Microlunatus speluncae TaxID=2594267 RepID=UPI00126667D1|nr:PASTA domain-containing protein [Microlunatus speluncae]